MLVATKYIIVKVDAVSELTFSPSRKKYFFIYNFPFILSLRYG